MPLKAVWRPGWAAGEQKLRPVSPRPASPDWRQIYYPPVYLAGIAVMLARLIWGTLQIRSMKYEVRRSEGFATSSRCAAPVTIGWLRPVLLLPSGWRTWSAAKLDVSLGVREREHIRRRDPLVQWLALLNRCIFWFHPLAWWLERKLAWLAEEACDEAVLAGGHEAHLAYAPLHLIEMARSVNETRARLRWAGAVEFSSGPACHDASGGLWTRRPQRRCRALRPLRQPACRTLVTAFLRSPVLGRRSSEQDLGDRARNSSTAAAGLATAVTPGAARKPRLLSRPPAPREG